ncbi:helix-turn-helix domain-containing protein [Solimonas flava]|uniref:helix-turn-helix domain-containing protein n=1 Tax=Solimonas flava TaxID=415849 RepID=UPI000488846A|nr:helix-turn-helix transcriptional regulator [Solimonas flava]
MPSPLGDKIRARRREKGMSLEGLAEATESSKSYIWELENRDVPNPSADKIARIAVALEVTTEYLLDTAQTTPDQKVVDEAFYRKYRAMPDETKKRLRRILDSWDDD